jgi:hypothetical protein
MINYLNKASPSLLSKYNVFFYGCDKRKIMLDLLRHQIEGNVKVHKCKGLTAMSSLGDLQLPTFRERKNVRRVGLLIFLLS